MQYTSAQEKKLRKILECKRIWSYNGRAVIAVTNAKEVTR